MVGVMGRIKTTGDLMVNRLGRHATDRNDTGDGHKRHQVEHHHRPEQVGQPAGQQCGHGIAGMVESLVAPGTPGEGTRPGDPQRNGGNCRSKDRGSYGAGSLGQRHPAK